MRILLTGSSGMVGRNVLEHPRADDYDFLTPDRAELNLLSVSSTEDYIYSHRPDMIIHCAGLVGGIQDNIERPISFLQENALMGLYLVGGPPGRYKKFINLGSSACIPRMRRIHFARKQLLAS